jgi:hypothetical protein
VRVEPFANPLDGKINKRNSQRVTPHKINFKVASSKVQLVKVPATTILFSLLI